MGDLHEVIVDNIREVVRGISIRFQQHLIVDLNPGKLYTSPHAVIKGNRFSFRNLEPYDIGTTFAEFTFDFLGRQFEGSPVILRRQPPLFLLFPHCIEFFRRIERIICVARFQQSVNMRSVQRKPFRLHIRPDVAFFPWSLIVAKSSPGK